MYWLMSYDPASLALLALITLGYVLGGWLVVTHAFRLDPAERVSDN